MLGNQLKTVNPTLQAALLVIKKGGIKNLVRAVYRAAPLLMYLPAHMRMMRVLKAPPVAALVERRPKLGYKYLYRPYLMASLTRKARLAILTHHYSFLADRVADDFFARIYDGEIELWRDDQSSVIATITLAFPVDWEHDYEGDLLVNFHCDGDCIYSLTFTIVPGHVLGLQAAALVLVAAIQGRAGKAERIQNVKDVYAGLSPPMLLLSAVEGIALSLGITMLAGIGLDQQVQKQTWDSERFRFDYDRFWHDVVGERADGMCYIKTLPESYRPIEEIKGKHRKRTLQRRGIRSAIQERCRASFEQQCLKSVSTTGGIPN